MEQTPNSIAQSLADRFTTLARLLRQTLGAPDYARFDLALKWAIWHYISRLSLRFRSLSLNPRPLRPRKPRPSAETAPEPASPPPIPKRRELPRKKGWLLQTYPGHHIPYVRGQFVLLLEDPLLVSLHGENPRVGRVLRPLCHMLAIPLPNYLKLERKPRQPERKSERKPARRREKKAGVGFYDFMLAKYPPAPPRPTLLGHIYGPTPSPKINFER